VTVKNKIKDCGCEKDVFVCREHVHPTHTPTPWQLVTSGNGMGRILTDCDQECLGTGVTHEHSMQIAELGIKDAAFIVRAVNAHEEMLESLRECADILNGTQEAYDNEETKLALKDAYDAIAQAEGK
jgi:hypothetical protein